ncbi:MAG: hypothetical protein NTZ09_02940 [Candidatus Hydrogenedentes bacterium]|nr:hypothetical protein [Candidatus Hydrogenedentota bacterium]
MRRCVRPQLYSPTLVFCLVAYSLTYMYFLTNQPAYAQQILAESRALKKMQYNLHPTVPNDALSATFVRTSYHPQPLDNRGGNSELEVKRTTISEVTASSDGIKESLFDAREIGSLVKRYVVNYAIDSTRATTYDPNANRAAVRKPSEENINYLSLLLTPELATREDRAISRSKPGCATRIEHVQSVSETSDDKGKRILVTGVYQYSDPAHHFKAVLIPEINYAISEFEEYTSDNRLLNRITSSDFQRIPFGSQTLWVPQHTVAESYRYDDYEGDSVQTYKMDILKPTSVRVDQTTFVLDIPPDAQVYDAVVGEVRDNKLASKMAASISRELLESPVIPVVTQAKGKDILARTKEAYKQEKSRQPENSPALTLEMPKSDLEETGKRLLAGFAVLAVLLIGLAYRTHRRRKNYAVITSKTTTNKGGDATG